MRGALNPRGGIPKVPRASVLLSGCTDFPPRVRSAEKKRQHKNGRLGGTRSRQEKERCLKASESAHKDSFFAVVDSPHTKLSDPSDG